VPRDTIIDGSAIRACTADDVNQFEFARDKSEGLRVSDPTNEHIGGYTATKGPGGPWHPVTGKKVTGCGELISYSLNTDGDEHDLSFNIKTTPDFRVLIDEVIREGHGSSEKWDIGCPAPSPCRPGNGTCFQAEITFDEHLYDNPWFKNEKDKCFATPLPTRNICVYGPWVMDAGSSHGSKPEIHPSDAIWWRARAGSQDQYTIIAAQDDSNRYDDRGDFSGAPANWTPWAARRNYERAVGAGVAPSLSWKATQSRLLRNVP
jgi:hypothetical protein